MEVMLIDWTSSAKRSSVISSMIASMDSVWLTTAVQMICVERTPSRNCLRSLARRVDSHAASRRRRRRNSKFGNRRWVSTFCTPKATSTSLRPSDHFKPSLTTVFLIFAYSAFKS